MEQLESLLIDYIDGKLNERDVERVEKLLAEDEKARERHVQLKQVMTAMKDAPELSPSRQMKQRFESMLKEEIVSQGNHATGKGKQVWFQPAVYRAAAAVVLVMAGVGIGYWINKNQQREEELAAIRKEMEATKNLMMAMLDNRQSASQRLVGVSVAFKMEKTDDEIVNALVKTMNEDANTNVRLAAMEALGKFQQFPHVRQALINSLATQTDPVVQIELIRLMVNMKEKEVIKELEKITNDESSLPAVKDEAHAGILRLS